MLDEGGLDDEVEPAPMVNAIRTTGGLVVRIEDLPGSKLQEIANEHDSNWTLIVAYPQNTVPILAAVIRAVYEMVGEDVPKDLDSWSGRKLINALEPVADDLPSLWVDGFPKGVGEATTTSSSGSSPSADGPPTKSEPSPTATSD